MSLNKLNTLGGTVVGRKRTYVISVTKTRRNPDKVYLDESFDVVAVDEKGKVWRSETLIVKPNDPHDSLEVFVRITMKSAETDFE